MRAVMWDVPQSMLDERRSLGLDGRDEMWEGVLHMVPPAGGPHQGLSSEFFLVAAPLAKGRGLAPRMETGLFRSEKDYRVPDQLYCRSEQLSQRGAEGAELVVEVRSDGDDTYRKLEFFAALDVREVLVLHPTPRAFELFRLFGDRYVIVSLDPTGAVWSEVLDLWLAVKEGHLHLSWDGGAADV